MLSHRRVVLAVGLHQSTATATAGYLAVRCYGQRTTPPLEWLMGQSSRSGRLRTASATGRLRPGPRPAWWNRPADDEPPGRGILSVGDLRNGGAVAYARG